MTANIIENEPLYMYIHTQNVHNSGLREFRSKYSFSETKNNLHISIYSTASIYKLLQCIVYKTMLMKIK